MSELDLRPLAGMADYRACVALQRATWGESFGELVPPSMLMVAEEMGGIAAGAFDGDHLAGFVFGISGVRSGEVAHWSDMLAVDPGYRGRGLGRMLKLYQRERLLELGITRMLWTYDPLVARNAHLNLNRLGATAAVYKRDAYGESDSPLHAGIGTDRLLVEWEMASKRVVERISEGAAGEETERGGPPASGAAADSGPEIFGPRILGAEPGDPFPRPGPFRPADGAAARVPVPVDIEALKAKDGSLAREWRAATREALEWAFASGLKATELRPGGNGLSEYVLTRG